MIELCAVKDCTGCAACYNSCPKQAIAMRQDTEGFLRPIINHSICIECHLCQKSCPVINSVSKNKRADKPIALVCNDTDILYASSSGGMFSLVAKWIFEHKGVIFGVIMDSTNCICHVSAENVQEIVTMRSSKYVQSEIGLTYQQVKTLLTNRKYVLFTGTPCQIAGLRNYLGGKNVEKLLTIDLVCHGTPSNKMFITYLSKLSQALKINYADIKNFSFRQERTWGITPRFEYAGKEMLLTGWKNLYMYLFLSSRLHRPCCYECQYATQQRVGDITLGDFWGIGLNKPYGHEVKHGCSLVLLNSEKGKHLFDEICNNAYYEYREWSEALKQNTQLYRSSVRPKDREKAIQSLFENDIESTYNIFFNTPLIRIKRTISSFLRRK